MDGWFKVYRKLADNPLWTCEPFSRGQAWIDLIMLASYEDSFFYIRNVKVDVKRGQVAWSEPKLAERWRWSRTKVRKFLKDLEKEQQLIQQKNNVTQIITLINYETYQEKEQQKDSKRTAKEQQKDVLKEIQEDKEDKELVLAKIQNEFYAMLTPFVNEFDKQDLRDFYNYWSEPNKSRTKIKYQLEKTWDTKKRLQRWAANSFKKKTFNPKNTGSQSAEQDYDEKF